LRHRFLIRLFPLLQHVLRHHLDPKFHHLPHLSRLHRQQFQFHHLGRYLLPFRELQLRLLLRLL
jgi:hypothetical protein